MNTFPKGFLDNRAGMRWIGDVHGSREVDYAIDSAIMENMAIGFLGDLTDQAADDDSGSDNDSAHVLRRAIELVRSGRAVITPGNHCAKLYRYFNLVREGQGGESKIKTSHGLSQTIDEIMTSADSDQLITGLLDMIGNASLWHRGGDHVFVHAGAVNGMFYEQPRRFGEAIRKKDGLFHRAIYGQTDGTKTATGHPTRLYEWVDRLEAGHTVVIGHDRRKEVLTIDGAQGGKIIHLDTGAGKGGRLSWLDYSVEQMGG